MSLSGAIHIRSCTALLLASTIFCAVGCANEVAELAGDASVGVSAQALTPTPDANCTSGVSAGREYWFCRTERSWAVARQKCQAVAGRDLVVIESATENQFV